MKFEDLSKRQCILISLIGCGGSIKDINEPISGSIKLMKEAFLLKMEITDQFQYNFVPYDFGPCSFEIYEDLNSLIRGGIIKEEKNNNFSIYSVASSYEEVVKKLINNLDQKTKETILRIKKDFNRLTYYALIAHIYHKYPGFTKASKFRL